MATETPAQERVDLKVVHSGDKGNPQEALSLLEHAHRVAEDAISTSRAEAERVLTAARHEAQQMREKAREQADREVSEATKKAETARAEAQEEADRLVADARSQVTELERAMEHLLATRDAAADATRELGRRLLEAADSVPNDSESGHSPQPQ